MHRYQELRIQIVDRHLHILSNFLPQSEIEVRKLCLLYDWKADLNIQEDFMSPMRNRAAFIF
jgi:hypothetical protein